MKYTFTFLALLFCFGTPLQAQWSADILVNSNLPPALDQITENPGEYITIIVNNPNLTSADGIMQVKIRNRNADWSISNNRIANPITFSSGSYRLTVMDIEMAFEGFGDGDITGDIPLEQQELIELGYLPGGDYELCLSILDPITQEILLPETCSQFSICIGSRPIIITPVNETLNPSSYSEQNYIPFTWQPATCDNGMGMLPVQVNYTLKMISITDLEPAEFEESMFEGSAYSFFEEPNILGNNYTYNLSGMAPDLKLGDRYAVQIIASTDDGDYYFNENGRSEIYVFQWGESLSNADCNDPDYQISAEFPLDGDTLPYSFVPCIGHFEPYCDEYRRFYFDFSISKASGPSHTRSGDNNWPEGPRNYLQSHIPEATEYRAARGVFNLQTEQEARKLGTLERGENYTWSAQTEMTIEGGDTYIDDIDPQTFVFGMPKPQLNEPPNGATVPPGDITFNWLKGNIPDELLPDFIAYLRASGRDIEGRGTIGNIRERGVFQLSTEPEFGEDDIISRDVYDIADDDFTSEADLTNPVYGIEIHDDTLSTRGTYYWRVVYLRDPKGVVPESGFVGEADYYHPSEVYRFTIGEEDEDEEETLNSECVAECELEEIQNTEAKTDFESGDIIRVGKFEMELTEVEVSGNSLWSKLIYHCQNLYISPLFSDTTPVNPLPETW